MSESLTPEDTNGLVEMETEKQPSWQRIIDEVVLDGSIVRLALTQHGKNLSRVYVLCSFDDTDCGDPKPEQQFDVQLTEFGMAPESFEFPRPEEIFSFRAVMLEGTQLGREIHTVQPGLVRGDMAIVMEGGWTIQ
jgi:hypothetical protein